MMARSATGQKRVYARGLPVVFQFAKTSRAAPVGSDVSLCTHARLETCGIDTVLEGPEIAQRADGLACRISTLHPLERNLRRHADAHDLERQVGEGMPDRLQMRASGDAAGGTTRRTPCRS